MSKRRPSPGSVGVSLSKEGPLLPPPPKHSPSKPLLHPSQLSPFGNYKQRSPAHTLQPLRRLQPNINPDLARALPPVVGLELLVAPCAGLDHVEPPRERRPQVRQIQVRRQHALAAGGGLGEGGARRVLVEEGGEQAAVHDARPAGGGEAEEDDVDDGFVGGGWGVEDVLVGADAGGGG